VLARGVDDLGLEGFPKTTGSRGIHVLVPIARRYTFEESRAFAQRIGEPVARQIAIARSVAADSA